MKYLDFIVQSLLFSMALLFLALSLEKRDWMLYILCVQFALGVWQYLGCLLSVLLRAPFHKKKRIHLILASIYLLAFLIIVNLNIPGLFNSDTVMLTLVIGPPWTLAIYYYHLTFKWAFSKKIRDTGFLRHLSF